MARSSWRAARKPRSASRRQSTSSNSSSVRGGGPAASRLPPAAAAAPRPAAGLADGTAAAPGDAPAASADAAGAEVMRAAASDSGALKLPGSAGCVALSDAWPPAVAGAAAASACAPALPFLAPLDCWCRLRFCCWSVVAAAAPFCFFATPAQDTAKMSRALPNNRRSN